MRPNHLVLLLVTALLSLPLSVMADGRTPLRANTPGTAKNQTSVHKKQTKDGRSIASVPMGDPKDLTVSSSNSCPNCYRPINVQRH